MGSDQPWKQVEIPFSSTLHDVTRYKDRVYAVGDSGTVLQQADGKWSKLVDSGPTGNANVLCSVGTTDKGERIWFAGASGSLGYFDVKSEEMKDFSNPEGQGDRWNDIIVTGEAGSEVIRVADTNGEIATLRISKTKTESTDLVKPKSAGQSITGLSRDSEGDLYAVNTTGKLFMSSDGKNWSATDLVDTDFVDVTTKDGLAYTATSSGFGYIYDPAKDEVDKFDPDISTIHAITSDDHVTISGTNGKIADLIDGKWRCVETPASTDLYSICVGTEDVAVGSGGIVIKRPQK